MLMLLSLLMSFTNFLTACKGHKNYTCQETVFDLQLCSPVFVFGLVLEISSLVCNFTDLVTGFSRSCWVYFGINCWWIWWKTSKTSYVSVFLYQINHQLWWEMIIISSFLVVVIIIVIIHFCSCSFVETNNFNSIFFSYCFICLRNPKVKNPGTIIGNFLFYFWEVGLREGSGGFVIRAMLILLLILIAVTAEEVMDCKVCSADWPIHEKVRAFLK